MIRGNLMVALLATASVLFGLLAIALILEATRVIRQRRTIMRNLNPVLESTEDGTSEIVKRDPREELGPLSRMLIRFPHWSDLQLLLDQAGLKWSVASLLAGSVALAAAFFVCFLVLTGSPLLGILAGGLAGAVPRLVIGVLVRRRIFRFEEQLPDAVALLARAIRAGHPLSAGIRMVAEESPEPTASEFRQLFEENRFGLPFEEALLGMCSRMPLPDLRIFATAVLVQREVGGSLAEILDKMGITIRERFALRRQLRTYTAQGRLSGYILGAMPIFLGLAIYTMDHAYMSLLFTEPAGRVAVAVAIVLQVIGYLWIRRIIDIEM